MKRIICFTGVEAPGGTEITPEYNVYWGITDGELKQVRVKKHRDLLRNPGFAVWPGPFLCEVDGEGFVTDLEYAEEFVTGYSVNAPKNGKIVLGAEDTEYAFEPDAPAYIAAKGQLVTEYLSTVAELEASWDANWFAKLGADGRITEMYVVRGSGAESPQLAQIKRFKYAWGPKDAKSGLAIEYNYYEPPIKDGEKHPLFIWFHGLHGGTSTWTNLFEFNPISAWTEPETQSLFVSGGAYLMTPRANEDLRPGHGQSWNEAQVEPFMLALDDFLAKHPNVDEKRVYVGGFSMGGGMTWLVIRAHRERFAAAVPCCPRTDYIGDFEELYKLAELPLWCIHGEGDAVTPTELSEKLKEVLFKNAEKSGVDTRFLILPTGYLFPDGVTKTPVDHLVWIPMFNNLLFNDGTKYRDRDGSEVQSTLIEWLNGQVNDLRG